MCISLITSWIFSPIWLLSICSSSASCLIIFYIKGKFLNFSETLFSQLHTGASLWSNWDHTGQIQNTAGANGVISLHVPSWNKNSQKMETFLIVSNNWHSTWNIERVQKVFEEGRRERIWKHFEYIRKRSEKSRSQDPMNQQWEKWWVPQKLTIKIEEFKFYSQISTKKQFLTD